MYCPLCGFVLPESWQSFKMCPSCQSDIADMVLISTSVSDKLILNRDSYFIILGVHLSDVGEAVFMRPSPRQQ